MPLYYCLMTGLIKGFKGKNGKVFDASLVLDEQFNVAFSRTKT